MIDQIEVRSALGELLTLDLTTTEDGLIIESIEGLDPVQATLVSSSFASLDGAQYQSSRRETRNIVITLALEPDYVTKSVRDLRTQLYKFFMPKSSVSLRFFIDDLTVDISGRVESFDSTLFALEPKVTISLVCFDPDFTELDSTIVSGSTVSTTTETTIAYDGTVESGIIFTLNVNRSVSAFTIYIRAGDNVTKTLDFAAALVNGDVLVINTVTGSKGVFLTRSAVTTSLLYAMSPQSNWHELVPGDNHVRVYATGAAIPYTIEYLTRYGGL